MNRVIRSLPPFEEHLEMSIEMTGRSPKKIQQRFTGKMIGTAGRHQNTLGSQNLERHLDQTPVGLDPLGEIFPALDEGRRIGDHHIPLQTVRASVLEKVKDIGEMGYHRPSEIIERKIL